MYRVLSAIPFSSTNWTNVRALLGPQASPPALLPEKLSSV